MTIAASPQAGNADQIEYWNASAGNTWATMSDRLDKMIGPVGKAAMAALAPGQGEKIIDIGCGCGQTTLELARRVGTGGQIVGVDISTPMLEVARTRAAQGGLEQVQFLEADAQVFAFEAGAADAVFSRFGVMFFADPVAAFTNIRAALAPHGRLAFCCWRAMSDNPIMTLPMAAALPLLPEAPPPPDPLAPGPFAFADRDRLAGILSAAGFHDIRITPYDQGLTSGDLEETIDTSMRIGPLGRLLNERPDLRESVVDAVRKALVPYQTDTGVYLDSATWIVTARKEPAA